MKNVEVRDNSIRLQFTYEGVFHRKTLMVNGEAMAPTPANIKYAGRLIVEIKDRIRAGAFSMHEYFPASGDSTSGGTVKAQLDHWLELQDIESSTKAGYESAIKFWNANMGAKVLTAVRHSDVLKALKSRPLHGKTINNYVSVLRAAMELAVLDNQLRLNPVAAIKNTTYQKEPPDPFDLEEVELILGHMRKKYHPSVVNLTEFRFFSGVRTSEMVGLQWPSIDWLKSQMAVREAVVRGERKVTKTNQVRLVKLNSRAMAALVAQKQHTFLKGAEVFLDHRYGTPWVDERAFRRSYWTPALKSVGVRYRPPNNARHTFATMLLMAGQTPGYAAKQMGHSVELFLHTYSKWIDNGQNDLEQAKLESFISGGVALPTRKAANES